jgi:LAO/AO transport system kinase
MVSAQERDGIAALLQAIDAHFAALRESGRLDSVRRGQADQWVAEAIRERFGREGLRRAVNADLPRAASPFSTVAEVAQLIANSER